MSTRVQLLLVGLVCFLLGCVVAQNLPHAYAQDKKPKDPQWLHGIEIMCRKAGEKNFVEGTTKKYGIEVFRDENTGNLVYISETGSIAVVPSK